MRKNNLNSSSHSSDRYFGEMTVAEENNIRQIETTETVSAAKARVILQQAYGEEFPLYYDDISLDRLSQQQEIAMGHFLSYPNPVSHHLHLEAAPAREWQKMGAQIVDISGKRIWQKEWKNPIESDNLVQKTIHVSTWSTGLYWVLWTVDGHLKASQSIVISR
jgi:hypothetical protein